MVLIICKSYWLWRIVTTYWILSCPKQKSITVTFSSKTKMSTSSSATASGRDQVPSNDPHLKTKICVFIVTRKDGTPFDVTSVTEEDIMEICVMWGHTHPLGVLWYSVTEPAALFHTTEEMQQASHGEVKAMELQDEPTAVQVAAPLEHHIEAYIAIVGGDHSKLQSLPWRVDSSGTTSSTPQPALANPHVGHLINTLALGLHLGTPRINTSVAKLCQVRVRCCLSSGTMRFNASKIIIWSQWFGKV